jgi:hypothetical protein
VGEAVEAAEGSARSVAVAVSGNEETSHLFPEEDGFWSDEDEESDWGGRSRGNGGFDLEANLGGSSFWSDSSSSESNGEMDFRESNGEGSGSLHSDSDSDSDSDSEESKSSDWSKLIEERRLAMAVEETP